MMPVGLLYKLSSYLLDGELPRDKFALFIIAIVIVLAFIALTMVFQYRSTFLSTYIEAMEELLRKSLGKYHFHFLKKRPLRPYKHNNE